MFLQLIEFLSDTNEAAAFDVLAFVREAVHRFDQLRALIIQKMLDMFPAIKNYKYTTYTLFKPQNTYMYITSLLCLFFVAFQDFPLCTVDSGRVLYFD